MNEAKRFHVRWMIRRDLPAVLAIQNEHRRERGLPERDEKWWYALLRLRRAVVEVIEPSLSETHGPENAPIVGFFVRRFTKRGKTILAGIVIARDHRGVGCGRAVLAKIARARKEDSAIRSTVVRVPEDRLDVQLFLKACGWKAVAVLPETTSGKKVRYEFRPPEESPRANAPSRNERSEVR